MPAKPKPKKQKPVAVPLKVDPIGYHTQSDPPITEPTWFVDYGLVAPSWRRGLFESLEHAQRFIELRLKGKAYSYTRPALIGVPRQTYSATFIDKLLRQDQEQRAEVLRRQQAVISTPILSKPKFDLNAFIASFPPLPRYSHGADDAGVAAGFPRERPHAPYSSQNGPSFPVSAPRIVNPASPPEKRKGSPVLSERKVKAMPIPAPIRPDVARALPTVVREGKKPKIVLCGVRYGLSYIFLWMGRAGWSHTDLERWCRKLSIELPSENTTKSRLRAGTNNDSCYGDIPKLSKKQSDLMSNTIHNKEKK